MAKKARAAGDRAACDVLCTMLAHLQQGRYAALPDLFLTLSPSYWTRLGGPPECRESDRTSK